MPGNVIVRHFPDRLEVYSPAGFPAGVTPANILRQVVPRNRLLADVLGRVGYVERAGYGVDMMYEQMLRLGKDPPWFIRRRQDPRPANALSALQASRPRCPFRKSPGLSAESGSGGQVVDLMGSGEGREAGVAFFVALYSLLKDKPVLAWSSWGR